MSAFIRFFKTIPLWAFALVLMVLFVNILYIHYKWQRPANGTVLEFKDSQWVYTYVKPGSTGDKAGILPGDVLVSINNYSYNEWSRIQRIKASDTVTINLLRNGQPLTISLAHTVRNAEFLWFYVVMFIVMCLYSIASLILIYKKPNDRSVRLFFLYMLCIAVCQNALHIVFPEFWASFVVVVFNFCACILGPVIVHFHLIFPRPSLLIRRFWWLPSVLYVPSLLLFIIYTPISILSYNYGTDFYNTANLTWNRILLHWITLNYFLAIIIVFYQYITIRDTLARIQLLIIITGSAFGMLAPIAFDFFHRPLIFLEQYFPFIWDSVSGIGSLILVTCILIAIFRYRIWDTEIFIRRALLYTGATLIIILTYLLIIFLINVLTTGETYLTRFLALAISIIVFLILRDRLQLLIDRIFHRESYDSAKVVSDFEEKLAGIYQSDELKSRIVKGLDQIFHFRSFALCLKKEGLKYEPVFVLGPDQQTIDGSFEITPELENRLYKAKVFSPHELDQIPAIFDSTTGELVVPMLKDDYPYGFFICGPKMSGKTYSMQDIRVLSLIAKRVIALFHTAGLYQKDLDRRLMLERERARISQDMHDDIGAGLTKIAMISEAGGGEQGIVSGERMLKIAITAREMINRLNVIVWALNPRYDNLDSMISYARRYFGEYLENFGIGFRMEVPEEIPDQPVTPDFRRNAFYAWQEAIHNAVKHGVCSEVKIEVKMSGQNIQVIITDNGKGFDQVRSGSGGNGLMNMKKRAEDLGGSFEIQSEPGKGTRVVFVIPVGG